MSPSSGGRFPRLSRRWEGGAIVALVAIAVNLGAVGGGFVFDDVPNIVQNPWIRDLDHLGEIFSTHAAGFDGGLSTSYYRPLMHLFYLATYQAAGASPWAFHLVNLLLHAGATALLYLVLDSVERRWAAPAAGGGALRSAAFIAGLLFATHPVHAEAVAWNAGLTDLSFTLFYLLALLLYLRADGQGAGLRLVSAGAFFLALLCKEPAATLPLVLAGCELAASRGSPREALPRLARHAWPHGVALCAYLGLRLAALQGMSPGERTLGLGPIEMLLNVVLLFGAYIAKLVLPIRLSAIHVFRPATSPLEPLVLASLALIAALAVVAIRRRRDPPVAFGLMLAVLPLAPALYLPALGESVFAERYLYLPSAGFAWLVALLSVRARQAAPRLRAVWLAAPLLLAVAYGIGTVQRDAIWRDGETLWADTVRKSPDSAAAREYLGFTLYAKGDLDAAIRSYREALRLDPGRATARVNLGVALTLVGRPDEAIPQLEAALRAQPANAEAHQGLGDAFLAQGRVAEAVERFRAALAFNPAIASAHNGLAIALARSGRMDEAIAEFAEAARLDPGHPAYRSNLEQARGQAPNRRDAAP